DRGLDLGGLLPRLGFPVRVRGTVLGMIGAVLGMGRFALTVLAAPAAATAAAALAAVLAPFAIIAIIAGLGMAVVGAVFLCGGLLDLVLGGLLIVDLRHQPGIDRYHGRDHLGHVAGRGLELLDGVIGR